MAVSTLTSKGQLTVPKSIRDYLGIDSGDKIEFIIDEVGHVLISPRTLDIDDIFGKFDKQIGVTIEDMDRTIRERFIKKGRPHEDDSHNEGNRHKRTC